MRILFFGTYDVTAHPRVAVLIEGLRAHFEDVEERNIPLDIGTSQRISAVSSPRSLPAFAARVISAWRRLLRAASGMPGPDVVVVGYLGHFDVLLARARFRHATIVLDYLISGASTSADRGIGSPLVRRVLAALDRVALSAADIVIVDTNERLEELPAAKRPDAVVVPVGATQAWFREPKPGDVSRLSVIFFGLFTPLQGTVTIGRALADLADDPIDVTMIGTGQEYDASRAAAESNPNIDWIEWISGAELPDIVARHDVCLGIVGSTPKGRRVVPTRAFQAAAAGCRSRRLRFFWHVPSAPPSTCGQSHLAFVRDRRFCGRWLAPPQRLRSFWHRDRSSLDSLGEAPRSSPLCSSRFRSSEVR